MIDRIKELIRQNCMCVLATCHHEQPHCSLMTYLPEESADAIYMVTRKATQKFKNLIENPHVSLLIDTRAAAQSGGGTSIRALTISGTSVVVEDTAKSDSIRRQIVVRHPHLKELAEHPDAAVIAVKLESFLLLDGALEAYRVPGERS